MKVTVLEYEDVDDDGKEGRSQPVCEYTLAVFNTDSDSKVFDNATTTATAMAMTTTSAPTISYRIIRRHDDGDMFRSTVKVLRKLFLPIDNVGPAYLPYQLWDGLQGLCSYLRGVVSATSVFKAAGVGNAEATALSAALSWALRDGTGMIGGLVYSYFAGSYFDSHAKEFRLLLADVINDVALTLDMIAPYFGSEGSIWILGLSTIGKTICGITAGATKGHITQHFAKDGGNVADLTAKESTQETLVSLIGIIGGVWVAKLLERYGQNNPFFWTWLLFGILTAIHVFANYKAVSLLKLTTLNPERTRVLFRESLAVMVNQVRRQHKIPTKKKNYENERDDYSQEIPISEDLLESIHNFQSPDFVQESLFTSTWYLVFPTILVSRPLNWNHLQNCTLYLSDFKEKDELPYVIGYGVDSVIYVWMKTGATMKDELQAYVHALLLQMLLSSGIRGEGGERKSEKQEFNTILLQRTYIEINHLFKRNPINKEIGDMRGKDSPSQAPPILLVERLDQLGWDFKNRLYLGFSSRRLETSIKED
mmetsp:Transcript_22284/g.25069  ORF Transcript_22284/g.25069 Transcript_22284/m.25069 type:complete len:537 (-) Transcript_22284:118-1728(-)